MSDHSSAAPKLTTFDFAAGCEPYRAEFLAAIERVLSSGRMILATEVAAFEQEFARFTGAAHAVGVNSGFDALALALLALGIGPGDEVITTANTAVPTAAAIQSVGATPRLVDVDKHTLVMTAELAERAITARTRCLLPVHLYGQPVDMTALVALARRRGVKIVEDCAHAHGATWRDQHVGVFGDIGCFSFYPTKNLGAFGDAGLCVTADAQLAERLRQLRGYGCDDSGIAVGPGRNSRLDELQAAILRVRLQHIAETLGQRRALAERYLHGLAATPLVLPNLPKHGTHAFHLFVVRAAERQPLVEHLARHNIEVGIHYPVPLHHMPAFQDAALAPGKLPVAEQAAEQIISLPLYAGMKPQDLDRVVKAMVEHYSPSPA